jgi:hypothetical protein
MYELDGDPRVGLALADPSPRMDRTPPTPVQPAALGCRCSPNVLPVHTSSPRCWGSLLTLFCLVTIHALNFNINRWNTVDYRR